MRKKIIVFCILFIANSAFSQTTEPSILVTYTKPLLRIIDSSPPLSATIFENGSAEVFVPHYMKQSGVHLTRLTQAEVKLLVTARENQKHHSTASKKSNDVNNQLHSVKLQSNQAGSGKGGFYSKPDHATIHYSGTSAMSIDVNSISRFENEAAAESDQTTADLNKVVVLLERVIRSRGHYEDL